MGMIWVIPAVLAALGVFMFVRGLFVLGRGKMVRGGFGALGGGALMAVGAAAGLLGLNIQTYQQLTHEQPVAQISFVQNAPTNFTATVKFEGGPTRSYDMLGDEWQMDARVLKWKPWANVAGLNSSYRLERLSGRYHDINAENTAPRHAYALTDNPGVDIVELSKRYHQYAPMVDAVYGSATYLPMADGASYNVSLTQDAIIARPTNDQARAALANWK